MKHILSLLMAFFIALTFVGCDGLEESDELESGSSSTYNAPSTIVGYTLTQTVDRSETTSSGSTSQRGDKVTYTFVDSTTVLGAGQATLPTSSWNFSRSGSKMTVNLNYGSIGKSKEELTFTSSTRGSYKSTTTLFQSGSVTTVWGSFVIAGGSSSGDTTTTTSDEDSKVIGACVVDNQGNGSSSGRFFYCDSMYKSSCDKKTERDYAVTFFAGDECSSHGYSYYCSNSDIIASGQSSNYYYGSLGYLSNSQCDPTISAQNAVNSDNNSNTSSSTSTTSDDATNPKLLGTWYLQGLASGVVTISFDSSGRGKAYIDVPGYLVENSRSYSFKNSGDSVEFKYDEEGVWRDASTIELLTDTDLYLRDPETGLGKYKRSSGTSSSSGGGNTDGILPSNNSKCTNTCSYAYDNSCDDGGLNSSYNVCTLGTDCSDCGSRDGSSTTTTDTCNNTGKVVFYLTASNAVGSVNVKVDGSSVGSMSQYYTNGEPGGCDEADNGAQFTKTLSSGTHTYYAEDQDNFYWDGQITIENCGCLLYQLSGGSASPILANKVPSKSANFVKKLVR